LHRIEFYNFNHGVTTGTNGIVLTTVDGGFGNWAVASHTASTSSTVAALHVQNETYAWFGNSSGEMFKSPSSTLALTILDIEHPDTICANSMLDYKIVFRVDAGVSVNQDFQFLLDGDNLHGSHVFYPGTIFAGDTGFFDLSVLVNNCDTDGLILSAQAYNSASNIVAFYGLAQDDTLFCADPDPYTVSGPHEFCPGETISISASGGDSYNWITAVSNPLLPINSVSPAVPTNYLVQIQQEYCLISDTVFTYLGNDCEVVPPVDTVNVLLTAAAAYAFSPNGDSVNDFFLIDFLEDYPVNNVSIFNRWGDLVESFDNYDNQTVVWDGTYKGASVGAGTYYFIIEYGNGSSQTGWVQIVL
jgi:gliding motility-associated-like protein